MDHTKSDSFPQIKQNYDQYIMNTLNRLPIALERGEGMYVYDTDGNRYLDFTSGLGVTVLGHHHPVVLQSIQEQAGKILHSSNLVHVPAQARLAELLVQNSCLDKAFFCNSGAEANEAAIKIARYFSEQHFGSARNEIITLKNSFHGRTIATTTATGQPKYHNGFGPLLSGFKYSAANMQELRSLINDQTCAIMIELIQGEGGVIPLPEDFIQELRILCDDKNLLLIIDEIQTGMGRTGSLFAYEQYQIEPDIITLAKGLANGIPIGVMLAKRDIALAFAPGLHGTTFGGNPFATTIAHTTLKEVIDGSYALKAKAQGEVLADLLNELKKDFTDIVEVQGKGLMQGIRLRKHVASDIVQECLNNGLWLATAGTDVLRMLPPLIIQEHHINEGISILKNGIGKYLA